MVLETPFREVLKPQLLILSTSSNLLFLSVKKQLGKGGSLTYIACGVRRSDSSLVSLVGSHGDDDAGGAAVGDGAVAGMGLQVLMSWCQMILCGQRAPLSACRSRVGGGHRELGSCVPQPDVVEAAQSNTPPETYG